MSLFAVLFMGLIAGFVLPPLASRFGKLIPADPGTILVALMHRPRFPKAVTPGREILLRRKWGKMLFCMFLWGIIQSALWGVIYAYLPASMHIWAYLYVWIISVLIIIDQQYFLLPDFFTIPLLFLGVGAGAYGGMISMADSFWGACFGYGIATASVMLMAPFKKAEFGGGDFKMMTALGAWLGVVGLNYTIILSFLFFIVQSIVRKNRVGAYGPALGLAGILIFFWLYLK